MAKLAEEDEPTLANRRKSGKRRNKSDRKAQKKNEEKAYAQDLDDQPCQDGQQIDNY